MKRRTFQLNNFRGQILDAYQKPGCQRLQKVYNGKSLEQVITSLVTTLGRSRSPSAADLLIATVWSTLGCGVMKLTCNQAVLR